MADTTKMKRNIVIIFTAIFAMSLASCKKWLDIQPESDIDQSVLFSSEEGFKEALLGIYTRASRSDLYGKELSVGTLEVLAQNYAIAEHDPHRYLKTKNFEYDDADFISRKDNVWKGLYHGIANANLILEQIDQKKSIFYGENFNLIKGETLALRAYLHFDALRIFAPSRLSNATADAIPYVTQHNNKSTSMSTVSAVMDSVIRDLELAKTLLVNDPIRLKTYIVGYPNQTDTLLNTENRNKDLFLQNRRHRLNYYAVCGALARAYLYNNDKPNALINAEIVINSAKFPWTISSDFLAIDTDKKDRIMYKEIVFGWYIPNMNRALNTEWFSTGTSGMYLGEGDSRAFYEVSGSGANDMRYTQWFNTASVNSSFISEVQKYRRNSLSSANDANLHYLMAPAIRLSELYYIAAEAIYWSNPSKAIGYINTVRTHRGIGQPISVNNESELIDELLKEYRKDLYAEGQLFYAYKRLHRSIIGQSGVLFPPSNTIFVFPLPDDEIIYGKR